MAYVRRPRPKRTFRKRQMRKRMWRKSGSTSIAKKALRLATQVANAASEIKYLSHSVQTDLAGTAGSNFNDAYNRNLMDTTGTTPLFNSDGLTGNKVFCKYIKGTWDIHMDNINNEEETVNFTLAVLKLKADADNLLSSATLDAHASVIQGQAYYDPRVFKILYYKHFTLSGGGTSPATTGQGHKTGSFYIPVNKMIRNSQEGASGQKTGSGPLSYQDNIWFVVHTDNTSADTENPRMNFRALTVYRDNDINY